jgi:hypothetical protein
MKIGPEHIGKMVKHYDGVPVLVCCVIDDNRFHGRRLGKDITNFTRQSDWKLVEEPKKPSERIVEVMRGSMYSPGGGDLQGQIDNLDRKLHAVLHYLDEQAAKK